MKETLCELGPLFVKLGQNLANRPDLVNEELMEELHRNCRIACRLLNSSLAYKIIEEETGRVIDETFSEISEEPIASASIGQVYKGNCERMGRMSPSRFCSKARRSACSTCSYCERRLLCFSIPSRVRTWGVRRRSSWTSSRRNCWRN